MYTLGIHFRNNTDVAFGVHNKQVTRFCLTRVGKCSAVLSCPLSNTGAISMVYGIVPLGYKSGFRKAIVYKSAHHAPEWNPVALIMPDISAALFPANWSAKLTAAEELVPATEEAPPVSEPSDDKMLE